jgi:acyl-coenzyme A thioesterase PaaI-like protein
MQDLPPTAGAGARTGARSALVAVADAARLVNRRVRTTRVDDDALARARSLLDEAAEVLGAHTFDGPHAQTGHGPDDEFAWSPHPAEFFPYSPVIGPCNPVAPPVHLEVAEDKTVRGTVTLTEQFNGPPWDLTHGGVVAMIFDELLGVASIAGAGGGFTGRLTVRYHEPTPLFRPLELAAAVTEVRGRKITVHGTICDGDVRTAEADGLFISLGRPLSDPP